MPLAKCQTKSKGFFQANVSYKKRIRLYYYDTPGRFVFVPFLEEIEDTKKMFRNELAFRKAVKNVCLLPSFI